MKYPHQRLALLTGVSVSAFCLAAPASAGTVPGILDLASGTNVDDQLVISGLDDADAIYGVTAQGTALAYAIVSSPSNGEIAQVGNAYGVTPTGGFLTMTATNAGVVTVEAIAHASNDDGHAIARGHVERVVTQNGTATGQSALLLDNSGSLAIDAAAEAQGTAATALATVSTGILQDAKGPDASVAFANDGDIEISAIADAAAEDGAAVASASVIGIEQHAVATHSGTVSLDNDGAIDITARAKADGFVSANADAKVQFGIWQSATGMDPVDGFAAASVDNGGTLDISVAASASAHNTAVANAILNSAIYQHATGSAGGAAATLVNDGTMSFTVGADAEAHNDGSRSAVASATAMVGGIRQEAIAKTISISSTFSSTVHFSKSVTPRGPVSIQLDNNGSIALLANATAAGADHALANAAATLISQAAEGSSAIVGMTNSGDITASAHGHASGGHAATAYGYLSGIHQTASAHSTQSSVTVNANGSGHFGQLFGGVGPVDVSLSNSGSITLVAEAQAIAGADPTVAASSDYAAAQAHIGIGILQQAFGSEAHAIVTNDGSIAMSAIAHASADGDYALAQAEADGFSQVAIATGFVRSANFTPSSFTGFSGSAYVGPAADEFVNSGSVDIAAIGDAEADGTAEANIHATGGLQLANGETASVLFQNSGSFSLFASGEANGANEFAFVVAHGLAQWEKGLDSAVEKVINSGTLTVAVHAAGSATEGSAWNHAGAGGFVQNPLSLGTATASLSNSGSIKIEAEAEAVGAILANASASAVGLWQTPLFGALNAQFDNEGTMSVLAAASASAEDGAAYASARATGVYVDAGHVIDDVVNSGALTVAASAVAAGTTGSAYAYAGGISMFAANHLSATTIAAGTLDGSILNSGELKVGARVDAANSGTVGATATGIYLSATRNNATAVNTGKISVDAVAAHDGPATAYGLHLITAERGTAATGDDLFTFTNDGGQIRVRESEDGGDTWHRGMAIDVSAAPNASVINLVGDGSIYGNIAIEASDQVHVQAGTTYFDGVINPGALPADGATAAALDSGLAGVGTLTIANGGNLVLADPRITGNATMYDGPAYAAVDTLVVASDGALTFELQPLQGGPQVVGSYGQLFTNSARLDGKLVADLAVPNGLFADNYNWQNVIDANVLTGQFDECGIAGAYAGSLFLQFGCTYDSNANVDLSLKRVAFDAVSGLGINQGAVAAGLEGVYGTNLTGGAADLFGDLFLITDAADYRLALSELSGSAYANYLQSFSSLGAHYNDLIDHGSECETRALRGSALECRAGRVSIWGQLDYQWRKADGDSEAGTMSSTRITGQLGVDASVGQSAILGVVAGGVTNHSRDRQFSDSVEADGMQIGAYAAYDPGAFFVKGITTYSWYDGKSSRLVDLTPFGGTFHGSPVGTPNATVWTSGLHAGVRVPVGASTITPYANVDYVQARLKAFTESGLQGAILTVEGGQSDHSFLTAGVKWAGEFGRVIPQLDVGYRYRLGDTRSTISAAFLDDTINDFAIVSANQDRGALLAGVSIGGKAGPVDLRVGYQGEFNGDVTSHGGNFKLTLPLGGHKRS